MRKFRAIWLLAVLMVGIVPAMAQNFGDVVITEVMYDDTVNGTDQEWVEIHNTTGAAINIGDWVLNDDSVYPADGGEGGLLIPSGTMIGADAYLVLTKETGLGLPNTVVCTQHIGSFTLGNGGDNLALYTAATGGTLIDGSLTLTYPDEAATNAGNSIEKCDVNATWSADTSAWIESTTLYSATGRFRFCTPGAPNTPCGGGDVTPPALSNVSVISNTQIDVLFNEAVDQVVAETEANYSVNNSVGAPLTAVRDAGNTALVHLTFSTLSPNAYVLTVLTIQDLAGNVANNLTGGFTVLGGATNTVVFTEVMYDDINSADVEWVEIYNTTGSAINIGGWIVTDGPTYPPTTEGALYLPAGTMINAGQYLVVSKVEIPEITGEIVCADSAGSWGLGNSGDNLAIFDALSGGNLIHGSLTTLYPDLSGANLGNSIEVCLADVGLAWDAVQWYESAAPFNLGTFTNCTPGTAPSVCVPDVISPVLVSATLFSANQVDAEFDEALDAVTANTATNYSVDNGVGNPTSAVLQADNRTVRLTFAASFTPNVYTLTVNNVQDLAGNAIAPNSTAIFEVMGSAYDIVFTEIMPNPAFVGTDDLFGEWFEVYNRGASAVDLAGWIIADNQGSDTLEGPLSLAAGQYFVFCSNGDSATNGGVPENFAYHYATSGWGLSLSNSGETISLRDASNSVVASVTYAGTYPYGPGISAQLMDTALDPSNPANWCAASTAWPGANNGDLGTPGSASVCTAPAEPDTVTICQIYAHDACGVSLWNDSLVVTYGVVTCNDTCRQNMYVESNGCAVLVFGGATGQNMIGASRIAESGDSVCLRGALDFFAGLTEFSPFGGNPVTITFVSAGNAAPAPVALSANVISQNGADCAGEAYESRLVTVSNVTFADTGLFAAGTNYSLVNGTDTVQFRVSACDTLVGLAIPTGALNVTGYVAQYDTTSDQCYCNGYQLVTSCTAPFTSAECGIPLEVAIVRLPTLDQVQLRWSAPNDNDCGCYNVWYATTSDPVFPDDFSLSNALPISTTTYTENISGAELRRIYVVTGVPCP
ncbi:MAG: lamin tail domain-containing protein [Calditrichaeota bacterium]|nr:lamin tail domain-containing protein [Calditrichota bacterium]MCB9366911.1 lamin tail domain-containing protein [Calditrichota bacterium]